MQSTITLYGRTYWDAELDVPLASLGQGKGKVDTEVRLRIGGFASNAARAIRARFPSLPLAVVTVTSPLDVPRLRAGLPAAVVLDALCSDDPAVAWPAISVVINPSSACRILRDRQERTDHLWQMEGVSSASLDARLHVMGRLPSHFVRDLVERTRASSAKLAWVGGDSLEEALERQVDILCVNATEAARMLSVAGQSAQQSAEALARRATAPGAIRVVTGAGAAPTAAAVRDGGAVRCHLAPIHDVPRERIATLLGVGDVFASTFIAAACLDAAGGIRESLDVAGALAVAQEAAARSITSPDHG